MPIKQCVICGDNFNRTSNQKTCSIQCSAALLQNRVGRKPKYRTCVICESAFRLKTSGSEITCGKQCSSERKRQTTNIRQRAKRGTSSHRQCVICGDSFEVWGTQKTCSDRCGKSLKSQTNKRYKALHGSTRSADTYKKWIAIPENREKVRRSQRAYELRRQQKMSADEKFRIQQIIKRRAEGKARREKLKSNTVAMRLYKQRQSSWQRKKREDMTPDELALARKKDREEMRRYAADPTRRARMNKLKRDRVRRRNADAFACTVLNAMTVLLNTLDQENSNE